MLKNIFVPISAPSNNNIPDTIWHLCSSMPQALVSTSDAPRVEHRFVELYIQVSAANGLSEGILANAKLGRKRRKHFWIGLMRHQDIAFDGVFPALLEKQGIVSISPLLCTRLLMRSKRKRNSNSQIPCQNTTQMTRLLDF
jgi:hypothetical protein